jgi:hypothetical protein
MGIAVTATGVVMLAVVAAISAYGARVLPAGALMPLHWGPGGWSSWRSKKAALIGWPAGTLAVVVIFGLAAWSIARHTPAGKAPGMGPAPLAIIEAAALMVLAASEYGAIRAALRQSQGG